MKDDKKRREERGERSERVEVKRSQTPEILGSEDDPSNPYPREMLNTISNQSDKNPNSGAAGNVRPPRRQEKDLELDRASLRNYRTNVLMMK